MFWLLCQAGGDVYRWWFINVWSLLAIQSLVYISCFSLQSIAYYPMTNLRIFNNSIHTCYSLFKACPSCLRCSVIQWVDEAVCDVSSDKNAGKLLARQMGFLSFAVGSYQVIARAVKTSRNNYRGYNELLNFASVLQ